MRLGEILGAPWKDEDLERKVLRVASTLSYAGGEFSRRRRRARRSVDLPEFVVAFLRKHRKEQSERKMAYRDVWDEHDIVLADGIGQPLSRGRSQRTSAA
jgi:integrase